MFKVVFQRTFRQQGIANRLSILLVKHEKASLLNIEYRACLAPVHVSDVCLQVAQVFNTEVATLNDFPFTHQVLHHVPERSQLIVLLALSILELDTLDADLQHLLIGE